MVPNDRKRTRTNAPYKNNFAETVLKIAYRFPLHQVFEDFLTMTIAACTQNLQTGKSYYEDEYLQTIARYKDSEVPKEFARAFAYLIHQMEESVASSEGNDVLGSFYEEHISKGHNGQYFTPFPICHLMASLVAVKSKEEGNTNEPLKVVDPACGSGRMLIASSNTAGVPCRLYGIDINITCVKMTALNLFLNGRWNSEVMCADALRLDDFVIAYRISFVPLGIFKIEEKEQSVLWHLQRNTYRNSERPGENIVLVKQPSAEKSGDNSKQLDLFS